jgi:hypothetical protein
VSRAIRRGLATVLLCLCHFVHAETVRFAVFGDTPYRHWERENLPEMMAQMDAARLAFAVNLGDIKGSGTPCSDTTFSDILGLFQRAAHPLIYTPGDNEWTDCERGGGNYEAQERLARLRQLFHGDDFSLGRKRLRLERQSSDPRYAMYREHARWQSGPLLLLTLNVPGSHNNIIDPQQPGGEYLARNAAVLEWLNGGFRIARERQLAGIVIFMHADPGFEKAGRGKPAPGYAALLKQLTAQTRAFPGQVLLVHGDSHYHRIDHPLRDPASGARLDNFTRLEVHGSPFMGWIRISADATWPELFRYESHPFTPSPGADQ